MRILVLLLVCLLNLPALAQSAADLATTAAVRQQMTRMHGDSLNSLFIAERLENHSDDGNNNTVWEAQGWVGYDRDKLWLKSEGESDAGESELQALYSRAISPFWDLQLGLRHDFGTEQNRDYAVIGLMGLAPYWFELDAAAFFSDEGDASARLEAEYELRFTQRLILQPRMELNYAFSEDLVNGIGKGMSKAHLGLRLRYEFKREIASYIGLAWEKSFGKTANLIRATGMDNEELAFVAGLRVWY